MLLDTGVDQVGHALTAAAALGDDRTQHVADSLAGAAAAAVRLALIEAASATAAETTAALMATRDLPPIDVTVQVDGDQTRVRVTVLPDAGATNPVTDDGDATARISLRLSDGLKSDIDAAATRDGVSVNTWLVRSAQQALQAPSGQARQAGRSGQRITGWVSG